MPSEKLMPCPFCGGSIELRQMGDDKFVAILCENCQASGPNHYGKHKWNSRFTAAEQADKTQTKHAQQDRVYRNTEPRDGFVEDGLVPIDKWGPPTEGGSTLPEPRLRPHNASSFHEPFGYWVKHKYSDGVLLRKPSYIPKADENTSVIPLFTEPAPAADAPLGAVENGRVFLQRLVDHYDFQCEAGGLANCSDYHEAVRCFEAMAEWIYSHAPAADEEEIAKLIWERFAPAHEVEWPSGNASEYRQVAKDIVGKFRP